MSALEQDRRCQRDPRCEYARGHTGDCTTVVVGQHVQRLYAQQHAAAYNHRLKALLERTKAGWLGTLIEESTEEDFSPLLIVGWVSQTGQGSIHGARLAETWHRERQCKRNRAMGILVPRLYMETGRGLRLCPGCGGLTPEEKARAKSDMAHLHALQLVATEGICWGTYRNCGRDVEPGKTACQLHQDKLTVVCFEGNHDGCDDVLETRTRQHNGSTYTIDCGCWVCHPRAVAL